MTSRFKYNGKELEEGLGYDMYEYEARHYDAAIARFVTIDPLAEDYNFQSTYAYAVNNPIFFIDKLGMGATWIRETNDDGSITFIAEDGDSALTLYQQHGKKDGFTAEEAIDIVEVGVGRDNYIRESDGMLMSNVEEGDSFSIFIGEEYKSNDGADGMLIVPDDADVADTADRLSEDQFESQKDTSYYDERSKEAIKAWANTASYALDNIFKPDPIGKLIGTKGNRSRTTNRSSYSNNIRNSRSRTGTASQAPSNSDIAPASDTRQINVRGHWRTYKKSGKTIWIKPHTRTIKNKTN